MAVAKSTILTVAVIAVVVIGVTAVMLNNTSGADITVYSDDGVSVSKTGDVTGLTILTASTGSDTEFMGWYDADGNLLSANTTYKAYLSDGDRVFAYGSYISAEVGSADLKTLMNVNDNGTFTVGASDYDGTEAVLDGTTVEFPTFGVYNVTYTDGSTHRCSRVLVDGVKTCTFEWSFKQSSMPVFEYFKKTSSQTSDFTLTLNISYSDYVHYRDAYLGDRVSHYLNNGTDDSSIQHDVSYVAYDSVQNTYLKQIADYITSKTTGQNEQYVANIILAFTQYIEYQYDSDVHGTDEYWQFPLETLFLESGDCEDTSILFCALAEYMGYDTCMFIFSGHMGAGVSLESFSSSNRSGTVEPGVYGWNLKTGTDDEGNDVTTAFYYGETTATGWMIGEIPSKEYPYYETGFPVSVYGRSTMSLNVTVSDGVTYYASASSGGYTTVTATVSDGKKFNGWYDADGNLLTTSLSYTADLDEGDVLYALADACVNSDSPIKSGETVNLSSITGRSQTGGWIVKGPDASVNGNECTFNRTGTYMIMSSDWIGLVYVYADVTVYSSTGLSVTVTGGDLCTVISVTVADGVSYNGMYTREVELTENTVYNGDVEDGAVIYVFSDDYANSESVSLNDVVDLTTLTGLSGTWGVMDEYFNDLDGVNGNELTVSRIGTYIVTCTGDTNWCGLVNVDRTGLYMDFDVSGWYLTATWVGFHQVYSPVEITGSLEFDYVHYSTAKGEYYMKQVYSWSSGTSGTAAYWTGDTEYEDYSETYEGVSEISTENYGKVTCNVWTVSYTSESGYTVTEKQYTGADDGYPLYLIEVDYTYNSTVYYHYDYNLETYGFKEMENDELELKAYTDDGVTVSYDEPSEFGEALKLTATVKEGYTFSGWYDENMNVLSTSLEYDGDDIYADGKVTLYVKTEKVTSLLMDDSGRVDLKETFGLDGNGTWGILTTSMKSASDVTLTDGVATFPTLGSSYYIVYTDDANEIYRCYTALSDEYIAKTYTWTYDGVNYELELDILYSDYLHYVNAYTTSQRTSQYSTHTQSTSHDASFVNYDDVQDKYLEVIANYIRSMTEGKSQQYVADVIKSFCSSGDTGGFTYVYDRNAHNTEEYWQFPLETLYLKTGDCEDTSILFAALAKYMGYDVCLFLFTNHMAAGVTLDSFTASGNTGSELSGTIHSITVDGKEYYYAETTNSNWAVGDVWSSEYPSKYTVGFVISD